MAWALIFDFDGVIVDSEVHWRSIEHEFLSGIIPNWSESDQEGILGMSVYDVHALLVSKYGLKMSREDYIGYYRGLSGQIYGERASLLPGVERLIKAASAEKIPLSVATSSPREWSRIALDRFSLSQYFQNVSSSDDVHGVGKPAPDVYLHAAKALNISPRKCVALEDTKKGIASAKAAGMVCVGIRNSFNESQSFSQADRVLPNLLDITPAELARLIG